jgi:hypothetical protein
MTLLGRDRRSTGGTHEIFTVIDWCFGEKSIDAAYTGKNRETWFERKKKWAAEQDDSAARRRRMTDARDTFSGGSAMAKFFSSDEQCSCVATVISAGSGAFCDDRLQYSCGIRWLMRAGNFYELQSVVAVRGHALWVCRERDQRIRKKINCEQWSRIRMTIVSWAVLANVGQGIN